MSVKTFDKTPLEQLHVEFVGRVIVRKSGPCTLERVGIITDIVRDQWYTQAVILWNDDLEHIGTGDNGEDLWRFTPVDKHTLNTITNTHRWEIKEHGTQ